MKHFQTEQWADLARGVASPEVAASMQEHLAGCTSCQQTLDWCKTMVQLSTREAGYEPPEQAVRSVKALAALMAQQREQTVAALIFDSFRQPALAGVRAASAPARQFIFESGDVVVDIKLDPVTDSDQIHILGQVMRKHDPYGIGFVPIALRKGSQQFAKTFANRFGEFQFEARLSQDLNLVVVLPDARVIEVPLGLIEAKNEP